METKHINYGNKKTELCSLGEKHGTDKSPFNTEAFIHGGPGHRHPYTCFYHDDVVQFSVLFKAFC